MFIESDVSGGRIKQFQFAVTATPQPLSNVLGNRPVRGVQLKNPKAGTAIIYIGDVDVTSSNGYGLDPAESVMVKIDDPTKIYVVSASSQTLHGLIY